MNTKNLIVLALVAVVVLTGALVVTVAGKRGGDMQGQNVVAREQTVPTPRPSNGTPTGESAQTSVEVVDENVQTQVVVE